MRTIALGCQRGHDSHAKHWAHIDLGGPTGFADLTPIPHRLARSFDMLVYDRDDTPGPLCPATDAVSEMIDVHGVWEPQGTTLALTIIRAGDYVVDFGCQVGWYSLLALSAGAQVFAIDADAESFGMLIDAAEKNGWDRRFDGCVMTIEPGTRPLAPNADIRFAKIDVEGSEEHAVRMLWPNIMRGLVDHIQMECSPIFGPGYPELVEQIIAAGYHAFTMPAKGYPPVDLSDPATALAPYRLDLLPRKLRMGKVANCGQMDVWFQREGASW